MAEPLKMLDLVALATCGVNVVSLVASPARQRLYDRLAGTLVVRSS